MEQDLLKETPPSNKTSNSTSFNQITEEELNINEFTNSNEKKDDKVQELLTMSLNQLSSFNQKNLNHQSLATLKHRLSKIQEESKEKKTNIIVFGDYNAGKTTLINSLIAAFVNMNINLKWNMDLLPSSLTENTYYITVVEDSKSDKYSLIHLEDEKIVKEIITDNKIEIKDYLDDLDDLATETIKKISDNEAENGDSEAKVPKIIIKIGIPGFSDRFRLIDSPGMTSYTIRNNFFSFLQENCLINIFVFVNNLVQAKVSDKDFAIAANNIVAQYPNSFSYLVLSQVDMLLEKNDKTLKKYGDNYKLFLKSFTAKVSSLNNVKISILSCLKASQDEEIYQEGVLALRDSLIKIEKEYAENIHLQSVINKLRIYFEEFNSSNSNIPSLSDEEIADINYAKNESYYKFMDLINELISKDFKDFNTFKLKFILEVDKLKGKFNEYEREVLSKESFFNKKNYIKKQIELLSLNFQKEVINTKMLRLSEIASREFLELLKPELRKKIKKILVEKAFIDVDDLMEFNNNELLLTMGKLAGAGFVLGATEIFLSILPAAIAFPVIGWAIASGISLILGVSATKDYIGLWQRKNCFDDVMECFYNYVVKNPNECLKKYADSYKDNLNNFSQHLKSFKVDIKENVDLREILKGYDGKLKRYICFDIQTALKEELSKLKLENSEDLEKIKEFINNYSQFDEKLENLEIQK